MSFCPFCGKHLEWSQGGIGLDALGGIGGAAGRTWYESLALEQAQAIEQQQAAAAKPFWIVERIQHVGRATYTWDERCDADHLDIGRDGALIATMNPVDGKPRRQAACWAGGTWEKYRRAYLGTPLRSRMKQ